MSNVYQWIFQLQDRMSGPLREIYSRYSSTIAGMKSMTNRLKSSFAGATQSVEELRRKLEQLKGRRDLLINTSQIKAANKEIDVLQRKIDKLEGMGRSKSGSLIGNFAREALPYAGAAALIAGAGSFFSSGISAEQTQIAYQQFAGSQAQDLIDKQNRFADATPFSNEEVLNTGRLMLGQGFKVNEILPNEQMVGDVAAGVQTDFGELMRVYAKAKSNVVVQNDILDQFSDRGIPILQTLGDMLGKTPQQIRKMAESGELNFGHLQAAFKKMTSEGGIFFGMLDKQSKSVGGRLSTFLGTIRSKITKLAESLNPILGMLLDIGNGLLTALEPVFAALQNLFKSFEPLFSALGRLLAIFGITGEQGGLLTLVMNLLATAINGVAFIVNILASAIDFLTNNPVSAFIVAADIVILNLGTIVGWIATLVGWLGTAFSAVVAFAEAWWAANAAILACPAVWILAAIAVVVAGIVWAWENVEGFRNALIRLWEVAKAVFSSLGKAWDALMKGDFSGVASAFSGAIQQGLANAEVKIKADKAARAAAGAPKVPTAPTLAKPQMPQAPGAGGGKTGKDSPGKAGGLEATTGGTKSTTITINLKSLVERLNINSGTVQEGIKDMEAQLTDSLLRVLNSANSMGT
ncbi:hypothetical protein WBJ53_08700 [Spirosoma sp. SC4-14]|uniref:hypothetical protein n=1 Tax=Spirosoma sp. SC4-14 TaxID=3128900 RepID=UPI0030CC2C1F